jgi:L-amino acid N-acyltransferase YncA
VTIRPATLADADGIADVQSRTWLTAYEGIVAPEKMAERIAERPARWRTLLAQGTPTWVAEEDGRIVGIMSAGASRDADAGPETGELWMLYVVPEAQRRGIGARLHDEALDRLRSLGYREATLWVFAANAGGRAFYERVGWAHDFGPPREDLWAPEVRYHRAL